jgi:FkbM family methyltransferase
MRRLGFVFDGSVDDSAPFGTYAPDRMAATLLSLTRNTMLGRGTAKWRVRGILLKRSENPIDSEIFGTRVRCYLHDNRCEWKTFLNPRTFDPLERRIIHEIMDRDDSVFLDIGANVGMYSLATAQHARSDARIIAFEPHPVTFRRLKFNFSLCRHPGIMAINAALGDHEGKALLSSGDLSLSSLRGSQNTIEVPVRPLADILGELNVDHVDIIKIDVEGFEDKVLTHFVNNASDKLVPEMVIMEHLGRSVWEVDCFELLKSRGLSPIGSHENNTFFAKAGTQAARMKI